MKTLNLTLRTIMLTLALVSTTTTAFAYDMQVNGVCYNINGNEATVTYYDYSSSHGYNYYNSYSGHVTIPKTVTFNGLSYSVTAIDDYTFSNCKYLNSISIPKTVKTIGFRSFNNCDGLTNITIPNSITKIIDETFFDCDGLTSVTIPDSVTSIGNHAFYSCNNLTNITIGKSVSSVGIYAFYDTSINYITCLSETPPSVNTLAFSYYENVTLYVPESSIEAYRNASIWSNFKIITDFKPNFFSLDDVTTMHGDTIVIPVMMENENDITAFQTDIYLVEGFEVVKDGDEYLVELSDRKSRDHIIMASETPDGAVRIICYSPTLKTFSGNEGPLFYITVKVPDNGNGVYPVIVKNTRLTTANDDEVLSPDSYCNVTVMPFIVGDVNGSGDITVADIVLTAKYVLYQNPEPFIFDAADLNGDGKITITDVVKIAHLVLDADYDEPTKKMNAPTNGDNIMCGGFDHNSHMVAISLNNDQDYTAFQLDLTLPIGMTACDFALTDRANSLGLLVKDRGNGMVRVLGYSPDLKTIKGNNGALLSFHVDGENEIMVDNIQLITPEGLSVYPSGFVIAMDNTTSVNEQAVVKVVDHIDYYNLAGQRIDYPENGVTLTVTTYTDGTRTTSKVIK
jgi:hypothetical protein